MQERKVPAQLLKTMALVGAVMAVTAILMIWSWYSTFSSERQVIPTWEGYFAAVDRMVDSQGKLETAVFDAYFRKRAGGLAELASSPEVASAIMMVEAHWAFLETTPGAMTALTKASPKTDVELSDLRRITAGLKDGYTTSIAQGDTEFVRWMEELRSMGTKLNALLMRARQVELHERDSYVQTISDLRERLLYGVALLMVSTVCLAVAGMGWWWLKVQQLRNVREAVRMRGVAADAVIEAASAAEERDRLRKSFLSVVAHELRTPLQSIAAAADMIALCQREAPPQIAETLRVVGDRVTLSVEQMKVQLMDLRAMARSKGGHGSEGAGQGSGLLRPEAFGPDAWFDSVKLASDGMARNKGVDIRFSIDIKALAGAKLYGDQNRLLQVATNLINNALKYTSKGEVLVSFEAERSKSNTGNTAEVAFCVKDTGSGIDKDDLPRVTELYFRGKNSLGKQSTGLGLEIVKRLVERMNGKLRIESVPREGTKVLVSLSLPILMDAVKPRVLIVDEERAAEHAEVMERMGWETYLARNRAECLLMAETEEFDLVLMECGVEGDGAGLAGEIKEMSEGRGRDIRIFGIEGSEHEGPPVSNPVYESVLVEPLKVSALRMILRDESRKDQAGGKYVEKRRRRGRGRKTDGGGIT